MAERFPTTISEPFVLNPSNPRHTEESPNLISQLKAVSKELGTVPFDVKKILPDLQENGILLPDEIDIVEGKKTRSTRRIALFHETLPNKTMEQIAKMYLSLKAKEESQLVKLLEEKLGVLEDFRALIKVPEQRKPENPQSQNPVVLRLKEELKKLFDHSIFKKLLPIPALPDFSFPIDHIWVDLKMEKTDKKAWKEVAHDDFASVLFNALEDPVMVQGEPGIGKSTFWKRMCREWAFGGLYSEFDLILPCRLREVESCKTILELALTWLEKVLPDKRCVEAFRSGDYLKNLKVLVILDGFDEYRSTCEELDLLFQQQKALSFSLLITSRPMMIKFGAVKWSFLKIAGLNWNSIQLYIAKAFEIDLKDLGTHDGASEVFRAIQQKPNLREMARIPLLLSYLCLAPETLEADTTTDVYTHLIHFVVKTHNRKNLGKEEDFSFSDPRLREFGKLALNGLLAKSEQLVFDQAQLARIDKFYLDAGLLARESSPEQQTTTKANFPHKTIQEYLAAVGMVLSMEEYANQNFFARLLADMKWSHWSIISGLIETLEEKVPETEFPARLEQTILFFIGITSNPSYRHATAAQNFLKAYLASAEVRPFVLTAYLKESKSLAFSEIITTHLDKRHITFVGSPSNVASFIQDAPDLNLPSFMWIINDSFDLNFDLLCFQPKKSAKLKFKSFEMRIELKSLERSVQQYLTDFVKLYFQSIVVDKLSISSGNSDTILDTHLYQAFSALSTSSCELVNIKNMENICNHSVEGMILFLRNLKPSALFHSLIWNIECTDFNPELLSFRTTKAPLSLKYLRLNFVNNVLDTVPEQHFTGLFKFGSKLLKSRRLWLSSKQRITINTNLFIEICELANDLLELRIDNICFSGSPINANTSFDKLKLWKFDALRITNISEANTNSVTSKNREHETQVEIKFHDVSVWNTLSGLVDLILGEPQILYLGYSTFGIAIEQQTIKDIMNWVLNNPKQTRKYLEWMLNHHLHRVQDHLKWVLNDPGRALSHLEWVLNDPLRAQDHLKWLLNGPRRAEEYVEWVLIDPRRAQEHLGWVLKDQRWRQVYEKWVRNDPGWAQEDYQQWLLNDPRRKQDFMKWLLNTSERARDYQQWLLNDPRRALDYQQWLLINPRRWQDFLKWALNDPQRAQDYVEWAWNDPQRAQDYVEWVFKDPRKRQDYEEWAWNDLRSRQDHLEWVCNEPRRTQDFVNSIRIDQQARRNDNWNDLLMLQDSKFWKAISICVNHRSDQPLVIGVRLPKAVFGEAIASVNQLITNLTPPLKDPLRCTFKGEEIEDPKVILERCSDLSMLDFILVINTYSDYSDAVLHVLDILS